MVKFKGKVKASARGNIWSNAQRGIDTARSARSSAPLQLSSLANIQHLRKLEQGANIAGKAIITLDAGLRIDSVYSDYKAGRNWQRRAVVETTEFGAGSAAGIAVGTAGKAGDALGQGFSGLIYDISADINWF